MAKKAAFIAKHGVLAPMDEDGRALVAAVTKANKPCLIQYWRPRNPQHHRLLFALLKKITDSGAWQSGDTDGLLSYLKFRTGYVTTIIDPRTGEVFIQPRSIAFESMDEDDFTEWFDRAIMAACEYLLEQSNLFDSVRQEILDGLERNYSYG